MAFMPMVYFTNMWNTFYPEKELFNSNLIQLMNYELPWLDGKQVWFFCVDNLFSLHSLAGFACNPESRGAEQAPMQSSLEVKGTLSA